MLLEKINSILHNKSLLNGAMFAMFSFINRGFSFLLLLILANYIAPSEYGYLGLFGTVVMVIGYFMVMCTDGYLSVAFFKDGRKGIEKSFSCILSTALLVSIILFVSITIGGNTISSKLDLSTESLYYAVAICFFTVFTNLNLDILRLREKVTTYGLYSCSNAFLNFLISILFVKIFLWGWEGRIYAQFICFTLFGIIGLVTFIKGGFIQIPDFAYWKKMLMWGIPLIPHLATNFLRQGCDRYIINYFHSIEDVGLFSFAFNLANIIIMLGIGFNQSNSVDIYKTLGSNDMTPEQKLSSLTKQRTQISIVYVLLSVMITLVGYFVFPLILPKYSGAMNYFVWLSVYALLNCVYLLWTNYLFFFSRTRNIMYITFGSAILHLLLSLLLTRYSLYLTCSVYIVSQLLVVIIIRKMAIKTLNEKLVIS